MPKELSDHDRHVLSEALALQGEALTNIAQMLSDFSQMVAAVSAETIKLKKILDCGGDE